jgi:hypothetical protein
MHFTDNFTTKLNAMLLPLAQTIGTRNGFFEYWFKILPKCKSHKCAFDVVNFLHLKIF